MALERVVQPGIECPDIEIPHFGRDPVGDDGAPDVGVAPDELGQPAHHDAVEHAGVAHLHGERRGRDFPQARAAFADGGADAVSSYRSQESYYNTFVYQEDTALPASLKTLFQKELGDGGNRDEGHTDYYTAITRIRSYLGKRT